MLREPYAFARAKIPTVWLAAACAAACLGFILVLLTGSAAPYPERELQRKAAERMERAESVLKEALLARGIPIETELDLNLTGLIGPEWTALTTTLGTLEAKRTVLDPNFAALMLRYFLEAGLRSGDVVAVGASGSFVGLTLATLCAAREMGLAAPTIASFGSSMYGATRPGFTIPDMMRILADASVIPYSLVAVSPGGDEDYGENALFEDSRTLIAGLAARAGAIRSGTSPAETSAGSGVEFIDFDPPDLGASIARRLKIYAQSAGGKKIACFVNVGGASPNSGTSAYTLDFPQGLVMNPPRVPSSPDRGLIYEYASRGVPVINLLNVRLLAQNSGLPYDPVPLPRAGEGGVYRTVRYDPAAILATLAAVLGLLGAGLARARALAPAQSSIHTRRERGRDRRRENRRP
jgi:poly-gamma-glutamate system protein